MFVLLWVYKVTMDDISRVDVKKAPKYLINEVLDMFIAQRLV